MNNVLLTKEIISKKLLSILNNSKEVKCAVAFWGEGSQNLFETVRHKNIQIICNLTTGGTNPGPIKAIQDMGIEIKQANTLHAKIFYTDQGCIIGSANASANGLTLQGNELEGWIEACYFIAPEKESEMTVVKEWFESLYTSSSKIEPADLALAKEIWNNRRSQRPFRSQQRPFRSPQSFFELIQNGELVDRDIYIAITSEEPTKEAKNTFDKALKIIDIKKLDFYENWSELKPKMKLVDIFYGPRGGIKFNGYFEILDFDTIPFISDGENSHITLCKKITPFFQWTVNDRNILRNILNTKQKTNEDSLLEILMKSDDGSLLLSTKGMRVFL